MLGILSAVAGDFGRTALIYAVGVLAMVLSVIAYQFKYRVTIIVVNFSGQSCWVLYFLLQSDYASAISCALTVIVMVIYSMKDKWVWAMKKSCILSLIAVVVGFSLFTFASWKDIFPLLAGVFAVLASSRPDEKSLRQFSAIWCALWLVNSILKAYPVAFVNDMLCTGSTIVSLIRYREKGSSEVEKCPDVAESVDKA